MKGKHYTIGRLNKLSFIVAHEERNNTSVTLDVNACQWILDVNTEYNAGRIRYPIHLYACVELIQRIADSAFIGWESPLKVSDPRKAWFGAREWSVDKVKHAIARRVTEQWRSILADNYPPWFLDLHKRIFNATHRALDPLRSLMLLDESGHDPYLISDVMSYRAAAHAMLMGAITEEPRDQEGLFILVGRDGDVDFKDVLKEWTIVYDVDLVLNRSKRRTIMNMPHFVSTKMLQYFRYIKLDRPLFTKQEVTWACVLSKMFHTGVCPWNRNGSILHPAKDDLNNAVRKYATMTGESLSVNATKSYHMLGEYIRDATEAHFVRAGDWMGDARTVTSLYKTAHEIHGDLNRRQAERMFSLHDGDPEEETKRPVLEPPKGKAITFLETAGAIVEEGVLMKHCIANYAGRAVQGGIYIFHIEFKGTMATAAVTSTGGAVQVHGPRNKVNTAVKYGRTIFNAWAKQLRNEQLHEPLTVTMTGTMDEEQVQNLARIVGEELRR